ncbi:hypothetical protein PR048_025561 [Dryococelus australis]|uniref:Uncharacterized protein n=1 Tax=Dryococelus australis TaxID=614101 RepID=A0ABQ9GRR6_9NEOP|nr:hypothetical protein PR048_025561 [Dryococelus australis]
MFYKWMVQTVRRLIRQILGRDLLTPDEHNTVFCECESLVNSRPITVTSETNHDPVSLTPAVVFRDLQHSGTLDVGEFEARSLQSHVCYRHNLMEHD